MCMCGRNQTLSVTMALSTARSLVSLHLMLRVAAGESCLPGKDRRSGNRQGDRKLLEASQQCVISSHSISCCMLLLVSVACMG